MMRIVPDAEIADSKLTDYLLMPRPWDDKSRFLANAGFTRDDPSTLRRAIRELADREDASDDGVNEYGQFLRVEGRLRGPNGRELRVVLVWMKRSVDGGTHLVTLKPAKERHS